MGGVGPGSEAGGRAESRRVQEGGLCSDGQHQRGRLVVVDADPRKPVALFSSLIAARR